MNAELTVEHVATAAQDVRLAIRRMRRTPAIAAATVLTLALGLGGAAAIFTASGVALAGPLPYENPGRLVHLWEVRPGTEERSPTSYPTLRDWRAQSSSFSAIEGYDPANFTVGAGDGARMLRGAEVSAGFFRLLGVGMSAGRDFTADEDATVGAGVAVVTENFARAAAGGVAPGRTIEVNGVPLTVIGVLPNTFHFALLQDAEIFVPLAVNDQRRTDRSERSVHAVARLRHGVSLAGARDEIGTVMVALAREHADALAGRTVRVAPLRDALLGNMKPVLAGLLGAVALLMVIMATNLALLMLSRYVERAPELGMRTALGATRARIVRQLLVESLVPGLAGAALAVALGQLATRELLAVIPDSVRIGMPYLANAGLDARVVAAIGVIAISLVVAFTLGPALLVTRRAHAVVGARTTLRREDRRLRRGLVTAQLALTMVLLVGSTLLVASFSNLVRRDLGFRDPSGLIIARAPLSGPRYEDPAAQQQFYEDLLARSSAIPGVREVALIDEVPGGGGGVTTFEPVDRPRPASLQARAALRTVAGEYFRTMGIPVVSGRSFDSRDRADSPPVAVISASLARLLADDGATIGRKLRFARTGAAEWEVVGVVGDVQVAALDADSPPVIYLSHLQAAENRLMVVMRADVGVAAAAHQLRSIVTDLDAGVPVYAAARLDQQFGSSRAVFSRRFPMILCGVFAVAALALTLVALYAISLHELLTRRREFGIRIALGAAPHMIRRLILNDAILMSATGVAIGTIGALLLTRSIQALLFGVAATDWRVYLGVAATVVAAALLSSLAPALRAGAVSPGIVMRQE
jgi:putative ABC transport system permease protein